jgi:hypothetical protein
MNKSRAFTALAVTALFLALIPNFSCLVKTMKSEELESAIEITDVETKWVEKYYQPWPPKLILVPAISFRVKNISDQPINYVNFNAIFRFKDDYENLGDSFMAAIRRDPVEPGKKSDIILLKCNYGMEGKSVHDFKTNPGWRSAVVKLFARSKGSPYVEFGEWDVSRTIDFKEPEEVGEKPPVKKKDIVPDT